MAGYWMRALFEMICVMLSMQWVLHIIGFCVVSFAGFLPTI